MLRRGRERETGGAANHARVRRLLADPVNGGTYSYAAATTTTSCCVAAARAQECLYMQMHRSARARVCVEGSNESERERESKHT